MAKIVLVKPVKGKRVLDPATNPPGPLPEKGKRVVADSYWLRREKAGEVTLEEVKPTAAKKAANGKE